MFEISPGLILRRTFVDTFGARMMAFSPPTVPKGVHPTPWAAVEGSFGFEGRVELLIDDQGVPDGFDPSSTAWLVAALFRLRLQAPVRMAVLANMPFGSMAERWQKVQAIAYESAPNQWGVFSAPSVNATDDDLTWVKVSVPIVARLYHDERFQRAFAIYDEATWSPQKELAIILIWTAMEILFDVSAEQNKTRAISETTSKWIAVDEPDKDRADSVIRDLYQKRGRVVHVGKQIERNDFAQSLMIARAAFGNAVGRGKLPPSRPPGAH
jgi:hypothetical protein